MATPLEKQLKKTKKNLVKTEGGTLREVTDESGRLQQPGTSLEASVLGASKDAAKMVGTEAQKLSAATERPEEADTLQGFLRRQQAAPSSTVGATKAQESAMEKAAQLERLEGLPDIVKSRIAPMVSAPKGDVDSVQVNEDAIKGFAPNATADQIATIKKAIADGDVLTLAEMEGTLGLPEGNLSEELFQLNKDALAGEIKIANVFTDDLATSMGFEGGSEEVASLLGLGRKEFENLSYDEFQTQLEGLIEKEYSTVVDLQAKANDPYASPAEREYYRDQLKELGYQGIRGTESDMRSLTEKIEQGDVIQFGDQALTIDEVLSNENAVATIDGILDGDEEFIDAARNLYGDDFVNFVQKEAAELDERIETFTSDVEEFKAIQELNARQAVTAAGTTIPPKLMRMYFDEWGNPTNTRMQAPVNSFLSLLQQDEDAAVIIDRIGTFPPSLQDEAYKTLSSMSATEIRDLGIVEHPELLEASLGFSEELDTYQAMSDDELLTAFLGTVDFDEIQATVDEAVQFGNEVDLGKLDSNGDGKIDDASTLANTIREGFKGVEGASLQSLMRAGSSKENYSLDLTKPYRDLLSTVKNNSSTAVSQGKEAVEAQKTKLIEETKSQIQSHKNTLATIVNKINKGESIDDYPAEGIKGKYDEVKKLADKNPEEFSQDLETAKKAWEVAYRTKKKTIESKIEEKRDEIKQLEGQLSWFNVIGRHPNYVAEDRKRLIEAKKEFDKLHNTDLKSLNRLYNEDKRKADKEYMESADSKTLEAQLERTKV